MTEIYTVEDVAGKLVYLTKPVSTEEDTEQPEEESEEEPEEESEEE